jgi:hypothetical protein
MSLVSSESHDEASSCIRMKAGRLSSLLSLSRGILAVSWQSNSSSGWISMLIECDDYGD